MEQFIEEPLKKYDSFLKDEFNNNNQKFFDELVEKSKIDIEANKKTCDEYYKTEEKHNAVSKSITKQKGLRIFLIILSIAIFIASISLYNKYSNILFIIIPIVLIVIFLYLIFGVINKKIRLSSKLKNELLGKMDNLRDVANSTLKPLFLLFDYLIPKRLIEKTLPNFKLDDYFLLERYNSLTNDYNMSVELPFNQSATSVVSGSFNDSPFLVVTTLNQNMQDKIYTGMLTIHWTTIEHDSNGKSYTRHHTQVLTAHSSHPVPVYSRISNLIYGNNSAPDLSFSRTASNADELSEKQLEKKVAKFEKKIEKKSKKDLDFTGMANTEFEALFNALDRDNELQFRLLFTPLAQQNEVSFIKDKKYFGDDFSFIKKNKINIITSKHSQGFDFSGSPLNYLNFDYRKVKDLFVKYNNDYFENLYLDFVPLLNIPIYQQTKPEITVLNRNYAKWKKNFTDFDAECLANTIENDFAPSDAKTKSILKAKLVSSKSGADTFVITANSFNTVNRVDYIPVFGGDGKTHLVPVPWQEYLPIYSKTFFEVARDKKDGDCWQVNQRGLKARIIN